MIKDFITHPVLEPVKHGFFTSRFNGLSDVVDVACCFDIQPEAICRVQQSHSATVRTVTDGLYEPSPGDGLVSVQKGKALAILTADCQPVLLADQEAQVIGAVHAGWRGARSGILENAVSKMVELGADPARIKAVIGPCISQKNYEVSLEFFEEFVADEPQNQRFFIEGDHANKFLFDLPGYGLAALRRAGVGHAVYCGYCTYGEEEMFFSHRRGTHQGRNDPRRLISMIML